MSKPVSKANLSAFKRLPKNKVFLIVVVSTTLLFLAWLGLKNLPQNNTASKNPQDQVLSEQQASPAFDTQLPNDDITQTEGGELRYDASKNVVSYTDIIGGMTVTISQQAAPEQFTSDPAAGMALLSQSVNAKSTLQAGGVLAHIGEKAPDQQVVVFIKNQVLVFITSATPLDNTALTDYINQLH